MTRTGTRLIAATALTLALGGFAIAAQHETAESDCPEDMNTSEGCQLDGAEESERQPVPGAATAPVPEGVGDDGTTTMDTPAADPEADAAGDGGTADSTDATNSTDAQESERQPVPGAATAPVPEGTGDQGTTTMEAPAADPESEPDAAGATGGGASDAGTSQEGSDTGMSQDGSDTGMSQDSSDAAPQVQPDDPNIAVAYEEGGRYWTADDVPTFNVAADGTVDWLTFSGYRRYNSECIVCHGPDGEGSTYAPAIKNSAVQMGYYDFVGVVVNGRKNGNSVMPHFGDNLNVMCYLDDIYVYLKARGVDAIPRGRPGSKEAKSDMIQEEENVCMG